MADPVRIMAPVEFVEPNQFNSNRMDPERYEALKSEMAEKGPEAIDPIKVSDVISFYKDAEPTRKLKAQTLWFIVDGEHRWRAAKELGWTHIPAEVTAMSESEAMEVCYRKNWERGDVNPILEARMFKIEQDGGLTHQAIADKYGRKRDYVTRSLGLLRLSPEVNSLYFDRIAEYRKLAVVAQAEWLREVIREHRQRFIDEYGREPTEEELAEHEESMKHHREYLSFNEAEPSGTLTKSHLEVISIMPTEEIMNDLAWQVIKSNDTVSDTERKAHRMRHEYEERMDLEEAVDKAQMKVCPFCGKEPARHDDGILCCSKWSFDGHKWSVDQSLEDWTSEQTRIADHKPKEEKEAEKEPTWFKSPLTKEQVNDAVSGYALKVLKMLDSVDNLKVIGSLSGEPITMELETRWKRNDFLLEVGGEGNPWEEETYVPPSHSFAMGWEEHTWKLATEMKTRIERAFKMAEGEDALHRIEAFIKGEYDPLKEKEG